MSARWDPQRNNVTPAPTRAERFWSAGIGGLVCLAVLVGVVLTLAIGRGAWAGVVQSLQPTTTLQTRIGLLLALVALFFGAFFFTFSLRYYVATVVGVILAAFGPGARDDGLDAANHAHGLDRLVRRGAGAPRSPEVGTNIRLDLGYEPFVSIHIATYNEKRVIERLLEACARLNYANYEVIVVDDSTDGTAAILEGWADVERFTIIHRDTRDGFKGGALTHALRATDPRAEYIAVFDADAVPFPDAIHDFLYHFYSNGNQPPRPLSGVAAVQSYQWHVLNKSESWLTEAVRTEYAGSYMVERPFQQMLGSMKMIAGTAYMIRARLLKELGWGRSLTEDWELTLRIYAKGYKVVYTPYAETPAECVATFPRLARQRMRWAEGHSYNVRKWFTTIMRSPQLSLLEKLEFVYYAVYYLQGAILLVGSAAWLTSELILHVQVPQWSAMLGWSLLFSNLLSVPLMNAGGLQLEGSPRRDYGGVFGALALSFLLVPYQSWAALKGLFERDEGPWYRTPKTGRITDRIQPLPQRKGLKRWLRPRQTDAGPSSSLTRVAAAPSRRGRRRLGWALVGAAVLLAAGLGIGAINAPTVLAANSFYLHKPGSAFTIDNTPASTGVPATFDMTAVGQAQTWATTTPYPGQTIPAGLYTFTYWTSAGGSATANVTLVFGFSGVATCAVISPIATWSATLIHTLGGTTSTSTLLPMAVPANSYLCWSMTVTSVTGGELALRYDSNNQQTAISSPPIVVPEAAAPLIGLALLLPLMAQGLRRARQRLR